MTADSQGKSKCERESLGLENADDSHLLQETQGLVPKQKGWKQRTFKAVKWEPAEPLVGGCQSEPPAGDLWTLRR